MKVSYDGLDAVLIKVPNSDIITTSHPENCIAEVQLVMENYICISSDDLKFVEYVGDTESDYWSVHSH